MIPRRYSVWQKLVALAPLLLIAAYVPGEMMLRCRLDGRLRPACCCPDEADAQPTQPTPPTIAARDCCDREVTDSVRPVVDAVGPADPGLIATALALPAGAPVLSLPPPPPTFDRGAQRYGPAREGPPLVLLKHAFLI